MQSYSITKKFFAVLSENIVVGWHVGSLEEAQDKFKECTFVEMTEENSPATVGAIWDGTAFIVKESV